AGQICVERIREILADRRTGLQPEAREQPLYPAFVLSIPPVWGGPRFLARTSILAHRPSWLQEHERQGPRPLRRRFMHKQRLGGGTSPPPFTRPTPHRRKDRRCRAPPECGFRDLPSPRPRRR